ncbi:MAG: hypothetical protein A2666_01365 [Parcubacteria group bacterium RIFCSPHIGHO2_01_FULL_47_10b]|nr:MAG: hypothetical protein A2666_01365 [Parcubacteria group bacterium RIFCSPHIGHO2_01_FULL_47_10b]
MTSNAIMNYPALILFDVDGTLVVTSDEYIQLFDEAFESVYGIKTSIKTIEHSGKIDKQIIREVLRKQRLSDELIMEHMEAMHEEVARRFDARINSLQLNIIEGSIEAVKALYSTGFLLGLITGNTERVARAKMKKIGLGDYFPVGGFGNEAFKRSELVTIAIEKAQNQFNFTSRTNVYVIGDTPRDIEAGKEAGVKTIGVATGTYSTDDLRVAGADNVLLNLCDTKEIMRIVAQ